MQNDNHPLVEAMKRQKPSEPFSVDISDVQVGDEVMFVVKSVQDGKAVLEARKADVSDPEQVVTQESHVPS